MLSTSDICAGPGYASGIISLYILFSIRKRKRIHQIKFRFLYFTLCYIKCFTKKSGSNISQYHFSAVISKERISCLNKIWNRGHSFSTHAKYFSNISIESFSRTRSWMKNLRNFKPLKHKIITSRKVKI